MMAHLKSVVAAICQEYFVLTRRVVHCLHMSFAPRVQSRIALHSSAVLLSTGDLTTAHVGQFTSTLHHADMQLDGHLLLVNQVHGLAVPQSKEHTAERKAIARRKSAMHGYYIFSTAELADNLSQAGILP